MEGLMISRELPMFLVIEKKTVSQSIGLAAH